MDGVLTPKKPISPWFSCHHNTPFDRNFFAIIEVKELFASNNNKIYLTLVVTNDHEWVKAQWRHNSTRFIMWLWWGMTLPQQHTSNKSIDNFVFIWSIYKCIMEMFL
jgi:hypothetical protein